METEKIVTVISPVFNGREYIERCIQNVIEQDCSSAEHLIVDGGSNDGTLDVIEDYASRYSHIRWLSERDRGQSDAMNKGIAMARGSIISFLNIDDFYEPGVLDRVVTLFENQPTPTLLVGNCNVLNENGEIDEVNKPRKLKITDLMMGWNINPCPTNPSQYFYHKSLHDIIGLYDVDEHYTLDIDFLLRAVMTANVSYVDEVWGNYRKIPGTKTVIDIERGLCVPRFLALLERYRRTLPFRQRIEISVRRTLHKLLGFFQR